RHAGVRAPRGPMVAGYDGGARSDLRFHRRLVQRPTAAFLDRLCLAGRFRTRAGGTHDRGGRGDGRTERVPPRVNHETPNQPVHEIGASSAWELEVGSWELAVGSCLLGSCLLWSWLLGSWRI